MKSNVKKLISFIAVVISIMIVMSLTVFASTAEPTDAPTKQPTGCTFRSAIPLLVYIAVFALIIYFLIIKPNKKRKKEEEEMKNNIVLGVEVTTIGGIVGHVVNIKDDNITIETSMDKTLMEFKNWAIREVKKLESDDEE